MRRVWTPEKIHLLEEYYPIMLMEELKDLLKISDNPIRNKAKELGLKKSTLYHQKRSAIISRTNIRLGRVIKPYGYGYPKSEETRRLIGQRRREIYQAERRRVLFGLPQQTKLKVRIN